MIFADELTAVTMICDYNGIVVVAVIIRCGFIVCYSCLLLTVGVGWLLLLLILRSVIL